MNKSVACRVCLVGLLLSLLFLTGCTPQPTDQEIYVSNFVLHNLAEGETLPLRPNAAEQSVYDFQYDSPGSLPEYYTGSWFFFSQGQFGAGSIVYPVLSGSTKTVFASEYSEAPEGIYENGLMISRSTSINYFRADNEWTQSSYDHSQGEDIWTGNEWSNNLKVQPRERKEFRFGGPYTPASFVADNGVLRLNGPLLSGMNTWTLKTTLATKCISIGYTSRGSTCLEREDQQFERPSYYIVKDGQVIAEGNLTITPSGDKDYGVWSSSTLYQSIDQSGNYTAS